MGRQYDVFRTADVLVVAIQSDLLDDMVTRVVMPLLPAGAAGKPMRGLNPEVMFDGQPFVAMPQLLATLTLAELGPALGSLVQERDALTRAVDTLLAGV